MEAALTKYREHLVAKGNRPGSIDLTLHRLEMWFEDPFQPVGDVEPSQLQKRYARRTAEVATDTHRNEVSELRTFCRWVVKLGLIHRSPAEGIQLVGRRRRGKAQLRRSEARAFFAAAFRMAQAGDEGALASLAVLTLGVRSGEIRARRVRDVDFDVDGTLLWIDEGKTRAAARFMELPEPLAGLLRRQAQDRPKEDWLFPAGTREGHRTSTWLRRNVARICDEAGVPTVCPHGLRGTWATLTTDAGVAAHVVARELGHTDPATTAAHYTAPGALDRARSRRMLRVVEGGGGA